MALGPGVYDDLCTEIKEKTQAESVILIITNGNRGSGFSMQADILNVLRMPDVLEYVAGIVRNDHMQGKL